MTATQDLCHIPRQLTTPQDLGFPHKFQHWRSNQWHMIEDARNSIKRFVGQACRPGEGKSVAYMAVATLMKKRAIILTGTKGLEDQLMKDFSGIGLVDIRGKANYNCDGMPGHTCEEGSIAKCPYRGSSICGWTAAKQEAATAPSVVTNYSCWIASNKYGLGLGKFDLLICDEFHNAPAYLAAAMQVQLSENEITTMLKWSWPDSRDRDDMEHWKRWAQHAFSRTQEHLQGLKLKIEGASSKPSQSLLKDYRHFRNLGRKLADLAMCKLEKWVSDTWMHGYQFDPVEASEHGERILFCGVPKVIATSGTINAMTLGECGVNDAEMDFYEYASDINPSKSPMIFIPTAFMSKNSTKDDVKKIVERVDEIIECRADRRIAVHSTSFPLRDAVMEKSRYSDYMISNYTKNGDVTSRIIDRFVNTDPPIVLVTPSITTGYDLKGDACRVGIAIKLPYPNYYSSKVEIERTKLDPLRGIRHMWITLAQMFGRADRGDDDWQEFFVLDNNIEKAMMLYADLAPSYLPMFYRKMQYIPPAPMLSINGRSH